ncbi:hypothetical protein Q1695_008852 [Nippostrongylus brasiliensis]|nr:hypothetical protein Q1695_008852 [Nippostrongylus brasiliensis]
MALFTGNVSAMKSPSVTNALNREQMKLHCSLISPSKQGDRMIRAPMRYSDMVWTSKRSTQSKRRLQKMKKKGRKGVKSVRPSGHPTRNRDRSDSDDDGLNSCNPHDTRKVIKQPMDASSRSEAQDREQTSQELPHNEATAREAVSKTNAVEGPRNTTHEHDQQRNVAGRRQGCEDAPPNTPTQQDSLPHIRKNNHGDCVCSSRNTGLPREIAGDHQRGPYFSRNYHHQTVANGHHPYPNPFAAPYGVPYYQPAPPYLNNFPQFHAMGARHHMMSECQLYRHNFMTDVLSTFFSSLLAKADNFGCCHPNCPWRHGVATRSSSTATIPALDSSSTDHTIQTSPSGHFTRPPPDLLELCGVLVAYLKTSRPLSL